MKKINLAYFYHYKQEYGWVGHFWQGRFKSQPIGKDDYFIQCGKYIELNPVRSDLAKDPADYPYSSYRFYATGLKNPLITQDFIYADLANTRKERQEEYKKLLISDIVMGSYSKVAWGSNVQRYNEIKKFKNNLV